MNHPTLPLFDQQSEAIRKVMSDGGSMADIRRVQAQFDKARDLMNPNWRLEYEADFIVWNATQSNSTI